MIDWVSLLFHTAWILGFAIILAAFSYHHWQARQQKLPWHHILRAPTFTTFAWIGLALIAFGLAGRSQTTSEAIIWVVFLLIALFNISKLWLTRRSLHGS